MATYYVDTTGNDSNDGLTTGTPFRNWEKLATVMVAGDIAYIRGGTYVTTKAMNVFRHCDWTGLVGTAALPITIQNYPGESPVFDFTGLVCTEPSGNAFAVFMENCEFVTVKGLRITGFDQISDGSGVSRGIAIDVSPNCRIENFEVDHMGGVGFVVGNGSHNLYFKNCDAHHNADPFSPGAEYGGADGFGVSGGVTSTNITFENCRAWWNSDDGFDNYGVDSLITYKNCWSFWNGYIPGTFSTGGNGEGFKLGPTATIPLPVLSRVLYNCLAFENRQNGFSQNTAETMMSLYNNTSYKNAARGFWFAWYPSYAQPFYNNIAWDNATGELDESGGNVGGSNNSWDGAVTVSNADFVSISSTGMDGARGSDGSLPVLTFMHLATGSDLVDAGIDVNLPFNGTAPDMGFYERWPLIRKLSETDAGFADITNGADTNPFASGDQIGFTVQTGDILPDDTYYWRVRAKNPYGTNKYGAWSATRSFVLTSAAVYNDSVTETAAAAETETNLLITGVAATESGTATETESSVLITAVAITETATGTDDTDASFLFVGAATETATAIETQDAIFVQAADVTEPVTNTETSVNLLITLAAATEAATATDTDVVALITDSAITEAGTAIETAAAVLNVTAGITETGTATETGANLLISAAIITEAATANDAVIAANEDGVIELAGASDMVSVSIITAAVVSEPATASDSDTAALIMLSAASEAAVADESVSALKVIVNDITETVTAIENISAALALSAIMAEDALAIEQQDAIIGWFNNILEAGSATETLAASVITRARIRETATASDLCYRPAFPEAWYRISTIVGTVQRRSKITVLKEQDSTITITRVKRSII